LSQPTTLGELIRERRLAHGMSLSQFAKKVGHSPAEVRAWERGEAQPDLDARDALAEDLEVGPDVLDAVWPLPFDEALSTAVPEPEPPSATDPGAPEQHDDTFLAVGGVVAGVAVAEAPAPSAAEEAMAEGALVEEPTEAIGAPFVVATPVPTETAMVTLVEPEVPRRWNPIRAIYDPNKPWLSYIRTILTVVALAVLALILFRLLGELFDALAELLDTVRTTDDVQSQLEALIEVSVR